MLNKVGGNFQGHSKSTFKCFPRTPLHAHLLFSQQTLIEFHRVQIRMSGDNFILQKNQASSTNKGRDKRNIPALLIIFEDKNMYIFHLRIYMRIVQ